jgi:DNA-binding response OmpR family regulator
MVVDDEQNVRSTLERALERFYSVHTASNGEEALALASESDFDLMLLDIHMPGMDGLDVLEVVRRRHPQMAIIMLTGYASVDNAVYALRHGAFNYLQKPASYEEILDSVKEGLDHIRNEYQRKEVLQQAHQLLAQELEQFSEPEPVESSAQQEPSDQDSGSERFLKRGPLVIDVYRRKATLRGDALDLTSGEYDLLLCLVQEAPRVVGPQELVQRTRGYDCNLSEAREIIRWQVYLLRQKIEADTSSPKYVLNVRGRGYMWAGV